MAPGRFGTRAAPGGGATNHDVFSWNDKPEQASSHAPLPPPGACLPCSNSEEIVTKASVRTSQKAFQSQVVLGEAEPLPEQRGHISDSKLKEMTGSGIFSSDPVSISANAFANNNDQNNGNFITDRPTVRLHQPAGGASSIDFGDESYLPTKALSPFKMQELMGTTQTVDDARSRLAVSDAKLREIHSSKVFAKDEGTGISTTVTRAGETPGGQSQIFFGGADVEEVPVKKVSEKKLEEIAGRAGREDSSEASTVPLSDAKLRELQGCNIFADGSERIARGAVGGVRRPPGGGSSLALV